MNGVSVCGDSMFGVFACGLLGVLMGAMGVVGDCMLENYTLLIEKHGCDQCMAVNTTICSGFCHSQVRCCPRWTHAIDTPRFK